MEAKAHADLRELARLPEVLAICSSAGWTDQKHTLYLSLLQESFVNQLHDGEISFKGLFSLSPRRPSRPKQSSKVDRAMFRRKVEQTRVPDHLAVVSIRKMEESILRTMMCQPLTLRRCKNPAAPNQVRRALGSLPRAVLASASIPLLGLQRVQIRISLTRTSRIGKEAENQEDVVATRDRSLLTKRWMIKRETGVASRKAELQQVGCLCAGEEGTDGGRDGSAEVDVGMLDAGPGHPRAKVMGRKDNSHPWNNAD